ncbi:hypothetical protein LS66_004355 [Helicobacter sp. MIT 03-1614]|uniref:hypothetical protein n=1 Tax=Helicobacter sp. MIT 03-1614 TaxID=1548147 RepID=UPI0005136760|nr:hypothetical protein [Helicobacter sp. MIT 03-1614]TLD89547.1 hypothetical protein LS66_004355 [Helicobacter sp. MIT 03-1614]
MQRFLQWYNKSTRNKIILFSVIFILALGYSFLHRPLGLIMWYQWSYPKEFEQMEANLRQVSSDEDKFLELYHNFYEKQNIDKRSKEIEKELLDYIDKLEIDLLATTFFGLEDLYLLAFVSKVMIYSNDLEWKLAYAIFKSYRLSKEQFQSYYDFFKSYNKFLFFVNGLDNDLHRSKLISAKWYANLFVLKFIGIALALTDLAEEQCSMKDDILDIMQKSYNEMQQINNVVTEANKNKKVDFFEKVLGFAQHSYNDAKESFNECK